MVSLDFGLLYKIDDKTRWTLKLVIFVRYPVYYSPYKPNIVDLLNFKRQKAGLTDVSKILLFLHHVFRNNVEMNEAVVYDQCMSKSATEDVDKSRLPAGYHQVRFSPRIRWATPSSLKAVRYRFYRQQHN